MAIESTYTSRPSALEMHWISEDGRLRSRWGATMHLNRIDPGIDAAEMGTTTGIKSRTRRIPARTAEATWLLGLLSFFIVLVVG